MGNWKAFVKNVRKGNQDVELYDLSVDPREQNNVAAAHPEIIKRVLEIFRTEHTEAEIENSICQCGEIIMLIFSCVNMVKVND